MAQLDVPAVVTTALAIADREGIGALSMRRVAGELGVTPMALYHHVESKERLVDLVADHALDALPEVDLDAPWERELERFFLAFHRLFVAHPGVAEVAARRPIGGPIAARLGDRVLQLLACAGFDDGDAVAAFIALFNYTVGASLYRISRDRPLERPLASLSPERTPTAHRLRARLARAGGEQQFRHGLRRLIDAYVSSGPVPASP